MSFKKPSLTEVVTTMNSLQVLLVGEPKWGKTSLFRNYVLNKYGDPKCGVLAGVGTEVGYKTLSNLNKTQLESWEDLEGFKKYLIEEKGKDHNIKAVCFDVINIEFVDMCEQGVIKQYFKESGKRVKFNQTYNGYGNPQKQLELLIKKYFSDIIKAGISVWCICHSRVKSIKEKGNKEDDGYQILGTDLPNNIEGILTGMVDLIMTGVITKDVDGNKKVISEERRLYFRSDGYYLSGGRFDAENLPKYLTVDKQDISGDVIETIEDALRKQNDPNMSKEDFKKAQKKEEVELSKKAEEFVKVQEATGMTPEEKSEAHSKIKTNLASIDMAELQRIMKDYSITDFKDAQAIPDGAYKELLDLLD